MRTLNLRFAAGLVVFLTLVGVGVFYLHRFQLDRIAADIRTQIDTAVAEGKTEEAIRLAYQYLEFRDTDVAVMVDLAGWVESKSTGPRQQKHIATLLDRALQMDPKRSDLRRRVATLNLKLGLWGECLEHLERLLVETPDDPVLLADLANCQEAIAKPQEAAGNFEKSLRLNPKRAETALDYAGLLFKQLQRPDDARKVLEDSVRLNPDNAELHLGLAKLFKEIGKPTEATAECTEAVRLAPEDLATLQTAAEIEQALGRYSSARGYLARARKLAPKNSSLVCTLAWLLLCEGKTTEAAGELEAVLKERPGDADALTLLGDILALDGRIDALTQVVDDLDKAKKNDPNRIWNADYLRARLQLSRGQYAEAATTLDTLRANSSKRPGLARQANYLLAQCYERLADTPKEIEAYRRVIDADPQGGFFRLEFARCLTRAGDFPAAASELRTALQRPDVPARGAIEATADFVDAARRRGGAASIKELEKALEPVRGDDGHTAAALARVQLLRMTARPADALKLIEQFAARRPNHVEGIALRVRLLDEMFGPERAANVLSEAEGRLGVPAEFRLARLQLAQGRDVPADVFRACVDGMDKFSPEDRVRVLERLTRSTDPGVAADGWARLRATRPDHIDARAAIARMNNADTAVLAEIAAIEGSTGRTTRWLKCEQLLRQGDAARAHSILVASKATDPVSLYLMGRADEILNRNDAAKKNYTLAIDGGLLSHAHAGLFAELCASNARQVFLAETAIFDRLRLDAHRPAIVALLQAAPASVRPVLADRLIRANAYAGAPYLVWLGRTLNEQGAGRVAEQAFARATEMAPLSDEAWSARVAYYAAKADTNRVNELVVVAQRNLPADRAAIVLVAAGRPKEAVAVASATADRTKIEAELRAGRITEARRSLEAMIARAGVAPADQIWARRTLAVNLTIEPSQSAFQKSLALLAANPGDDDDKRAIASVYAAQRSRPLPGSSTARSEARRRLADLAQPKPDDLILMARLARADLDNPTYTKIIQQLQSLANTDYAIALFLAQECLRDGKPEAESLAARLRTLGPDKVETVFTSAAARALAGDAAGAVKLLDTYIMTASAGNERAARQVRCGHAAFDWLHGLPLAGNADTAAAVRVAAIRWYQAGLGRDPLALLQLVTLLGESDRLANALDMLRDPSVRGQFSVEALAAAYVTALRRGPATEQQTQAVERLLKSMLREQPESAALQLALADLYEQTRRSAQAEAIYTAILARDPQNLPAANNLVWTAVGDPAKIPDALRRIDQAIDDHGPLDDLLDTRGRLLVAAGRFDDGIRDLREAADAAPTAARFIQLAVVYRQAGRLNEAAEAVQIARRFGLRPADIAPHDTDAVRDLTKN